MFFLCAYFSMKEVFPEVAKHDRTASYQGAIQAISLAVTLGFALVGGLLVGRFTPAFTFFNSLDLTHC